MDEYQHYLFDDYIHPTGAVKVLGFSAAKHSAARGEAVGDALLRYLAAHPWTAANIARKLCVRLVSDTPSAALVKAVAAAYTAHKTAILPMVSTILRSTEFWESRGRKVRRPAENVVATVRALWPTVSDYESVCTSMHWITSSMGNVPLDWPSPNGYPDTAQAWRSAGNILTEWNTHLGLVGNWWAGSKTADPSTFYAGATTSGEAVAMMVKRLTGQKFSAAHLRVLQTFLGGEAVSTPLGKSALRWLSGPLAAVILDSPHHALR